MRRLMVPAFALVLAGCAADPLKPSPIPPSIDSPQRLPVGANQTWDYPRPVTATDTMTGGASNAAPEPTTTGAEHKYKARDERRRYRARFFRSGSGR